MKQTDELKERKETKELISEADMELSDDDLDNVSGGLKSSSDIDPHSGMTVMS